MSLRDKVLLKLRVFLMIKPIDRVVLLLLIKYALKIKNNHLRRYHLLGPFEVKRYYMSNNQSENYSQIVCLTIGIYKGIKVAYDFGSTMYSFTLHTYLNIIKLRY